jgi:hypothetical protein
MFVIIRIKKVDYIHCDEVFEHALIYCKGSRSSRELIKKKDIDEDNYIFAKLSKTTKGKWITSDGSSSKMDKILFTYNFVKNIKEIKNKIKQKHSESEQEEGEICEAPPIINLEDNEKFRDCDDNILYIETRGNERKADKVYFRVKDVSKVFNMKNLQNIIIKQNTSYQNKYDYKYFIFRESKKIQKKIFLTLSGFRRMIEVNKSLLFSHKSKYSIHKWLDQFDTNKLSTYIVDKKQNIINSKTGMVYCITSLNINHIKIGFWRGTYETLYSRYVTYYGDKLDIFYVNTFDARKLEQMCHTYFEDERISNELFDKNKHEEYKLYLEKNKEDVLCSSKEHFNNMDKIHNKNNLNKYEYFDEYELLKHKNEIILKQNAQIENKENEILKLKLQLSKLK